jgi:hypothetical protein
MATGAAGVAALAAEALARGAAKSTATVSVMDPDAGVSSLMFNAGLSVAAKAVAVGPLLAVSAGMEAATSAPTAGSDAACAALVADAEASPLGATAAVDLSALSPPPPPPQPPSKAQAVIKVAKVVRRGVVIDMLVDRCRYFMVL